MTTAATTETLTIRDSYKDSRVVVDIETTIDKNMPAKVRDMMTTQTLVKSAIFFLKKVDIQNPGEAADLLHSATIDIWDEVDHENND